MLCSKSHQVKHIHLKVLPLLYYLIPLSPHCMHSFCSKTVELIPSKSHSTGWIPLKQISLLHVPGWATSMITESQISCLRLLLCYMAEFKSFVWGSWHYHNLAQSLCKSILTHYHAAQLSNFYPSNADKTCNNIQDYSIKHLGWH